MKTPQSVHVDKMNAATYFARFAELLKDNPPTIRSFTDWSVQVSRLDRVSIWRRLPPNIQQAFARGHAG